MAFGVSSHYDSQIFSYMSGGQDSMGIRLSYDGVKALRYGENPHQQAKYYGNLEEVFEQLHGKEMSYNNLLDIESAIQLMSEFTEPCFAIIKHTNACGIAFGTTMGEAYLRALSCDPESAFGGILIGNREIDLEAAKSMNDLFFEVLIAPSFTGEALEILQSKKNRILLQLKRYPQSKKQVRSLLDGLLEQDRDLQKEDESAFRTVTEKEPSVEEKKDLELAVIMAKHLKSNTIALVKDGILIGMGTGQTSRVDALRQAIRKAGVMGFSTEGAVMASDAFFPFSDCVEIGFEAGIRAIVQPGGSIRDQESIDFCNKNGVSMVFTGVRHFKH